MKVVVASINPAIERLLVVEGNSLGRVHTLALSETLAGGKGVNVARILLSLSAIDPQPRRALKAELIGPAGGPTGDLLTSLLASENLGWRGVQVSGWTRVNEVIIDSADPSGTTVYNAEGAALTLEELDRLIAACDDELDGADMLVCTGSLPRGVDTAFYADWIAEARRRGIPSLLDSRESALRDGLAGEPNIVKINRDEAVELLGAHTDAASADVAHALRQRGVQSVVVTDGQLPAVAATDDGVFRVLPAVVPTRSAVGSGDAFTAGLVWSLLQSPDAGWPTHLALAAACGGSNAASTTAALSPQHSPFDLVPGVAVELLL